MSVPAQLFILWCVIAAMMLTALAGLLFTWASSDAGYRTLDRWRDPKRSPAILWWRRRQARKALAMS